MFVARVCFGFELEASLNLETNVSREISDIPQSIWFTFEDRDNDCSVWGQ